MAGEVPDASLRGTRTTAAASNSLSAAMARAAWRMAHARHWHCMAQNILICPRGSPDFNGKCWHHCGLGRGRGAMGCNCLRLPCRQRSRARDMRRGARLLAWTAALHPVSVSASSRPTPRRGAARPAERPPRYHAAAYITGQSPESTFPCVSQRHLVLPGGRGRAADQR